VTLLAAIFLAIVVGYLGVDVYGELFKRRPHE
jgi:hypothetical protein